MPVTKTKQNVLTVIENLLKENIKHVNEGEKDALVASFDEDVVMFELPQPLEFKGKKSLNERLTKWFDSYKGKINQEIKNLKIFAGDETAFSHHLMRTWGTSAEGEKRDMWYRVTTGFKQVDGKWLIVHEHISEPIDFDSGKAMFDLKP